MIQSAEEFVALRRSDRQEEYLRAASDAASDMVWLEVIERFPEMRIWVSHNKNVSLKVLVVLAGDPDPEVRAAVAMKNKLSFELFSALASDPDETVRQRIAYNKKTPIEVLRRLGADESELVSVPARERVQHREKPQ